jgi:hypothetical protein
MHTDKNLGFAIPVNTKYCHATCLPGNIADNAILILVIHDPCHDYEMSPALHLLSNMERAMITNFESFCILLDTFG